MNVRRRRWARALPFVALVAGSVLAALAAAGPGARGEPLDPRSTAPLGARALVLLLDAYGADVGIGGRLPETAGATAVLLEDRLHDEAAADLRAWVVRGGTLVVADPRSRFAPRLAGLAAGETHAPSPQCELPVLANVRRIEAEAAFGFEVRHGELGCFPGRTSALLVARPVGAGAVVALATPAPLLNRFLHRADNSALALALVAPAPGTEVVFLEPDAAGSGDDDLLALVPRRVEDGLRQLAIAALLLVAWRARRLNRPVEEVLPVQIPASELVTAVGNLLQSARRREEAASMLRVQLRRVLAERVGVPFDAPVDAAAAATESRTGVSADRVADALLVRPLPDDAALVTLATTIDEISREVTDVRPT